MLPTLDRVRSENSGSFAGWLAGVTGRRMKLHRRFVADRAVGTNLVIVSTPILAFLARLVEALEPVGVQTLGTELPVQAFDEGIVGGLARA
jgi:hypothetical protein